MIFGSIKRTQIQPMLLATRAAVKELEVAEKLTAQGCATCAHFSGGVKRVCQKHGEVPSDFQPIGCDDWTHDDIPF